MEKITSYIINDGHFKKGDKPLKHKDGCKCFRCSKKVWNKGKKMSEDFKQKISKIQNDKSPFKQFQNREWFEQKYLIEKKSYREIANEVNAKQGWVQFWMEKFNIPRRPFISKMIKEKNPNWKGGIRIFSEYRYILDREHLNSGRNGYIAEHNLVMSKYIKRPLLKTETVHHLDGNKLNNNIENLLLLSNGQNSHHRFEQRVLLFAKQLIWGDIKPELKKKLQNLFKKFSKE